MIRTLGLLVLSTAIVGCGTETYVLGTRDSYLFTARDALALPGEQVRLQARLQGGDFLLDMPGYVVRFARDGKLYRAAQTNDEGLATVTFTPPEPGDYLFVAETAPVGFSDSPPQPQELLVACREPDTPMAVVDLDKTLVADGFHSVLIGDPQPMPDSVEVMQRLASDHTIVYLTHRPDVFTNKSKSWLAEHGYPPGPVLLSSVSEFLKGSGAYKTEMLRELTSRFDEIRVGIGDKVSDAQAYYDTGLESICILPMPARDDPQQYEMLAEKVSTLPGEVHVVTDWGEVRGVLFDGLTFPPSRIVERLKSKAAELEAAEKSAGGQP
ncbi:MAG: hypothetical protein ACOC9S_05385 [Planctomycetota bacterium]